MSTFIELATQLVSAQVSNAPMSTDEILASLGRIHAAMKELATGIPADKPAASAAKVMTVAEAFQKDHVSCMICGKNYKVLTYHLRASHALTPRDYRKQFSIPKDQPLCAQVVHEASKQRLQKLQVPAPSPAAQAEAPPVQAEAPPVQPMRGRPKGRRTSAAAEDALAPMSPAAAEHPAPVATAAISTQEPVQTAAAPTAKVRRRRITALQDPGPAGP